MGFNSCKSVIVLLVDGLGLANLEAFQGHAPNLMRAMKAKPASIRTECPSTTVASVASLLTGVRSAEHGLIGYNVLDPRQGEVVNLLSGWEVNGNDPAEWKKVQPLATRHTNVCVVSQDVYRNSGFTSLTTGSATFYGEASIGERLQTASRLANRLGQVVYCYVPELDQAGHRFGSTSDQWLSALEELDSAFGHASKSSVAAWVITGDHGMVDVQANDHIYLDQLGSLSNIDFKVGGDTRCAFLYFDEPGDSGTLAKDLSSELSSAAWVTTWPQLVEAGWQVQGSVSRTLPDLVVLARSSVAFYDRRTAKPSSLKMIGHHGSITDSETRVPLIRLGL
ncbi:MAG: alkaline phosphatase family protein [Microbacteriaceae bacterium]